VGLDVVAGLPIYPRQLLRWGCGQCGCSLLRAGKTPCEMMVRSAEKSKILFRRLPQRYDTRMMATKLVDKYVTEVVLSFVGCLALQKAKADRREVTVTCTCLSALHQEMPRDDAESWGHSNSLCTYLPTNLSYSTSISVPFCLPA
jgi:hypothetical protein